MQRLLGLFRKPTAVLISLALGGPMAARGGEGMGCSRQRYGLSHKERNLEHNSAVWQGYRLFGLDEAGQQNLGKRFHLKPDTSLPIRMKGERSTALAGREWTML